MPYLLFLKKWQNFKLSSAAFFCVCVCVGGGGGGGGAVDTGAEPM